jgi:hypothetical protein
MLRWLLIMIIGVFAATSSPAFAQRRLNSVQSWVTPADLPPGKPGVSKFAISYVEYEISETGRVDKCRVKLSDVDSLGKLTCALITERARYAPAADKAGKPVRSRDLMVVEWGTAPAITIAGTIDYGGAWPKTFPETWMFNPSVRKDPINHKGKAFFRFRIGMDGRVGECVAAALQGDPDDGKYICARFRENAFFFPPADERGQPYETVATVKYTWADPVRSYGR